MALGTGLAAQAGIAAESVWGTAVTVTRFLPVTETVKNNIARIESGGIIAGARVMRSQQWRPGNSDISGDLNMELYNLSIGLFLRMMFGTVVTAGSGPYTHTFTPGDLDDSFTLQLGRPDVGATVNAFTYAGCMVQNWELSCAAGEIASLRLGIVGKSEVTNVALASASYASGLKPFTFIDGAVTIAGSAINCKSITLAGDNGLAVDRRFLGAATIGAIPLEAALRTYTGNITMEFVGLTAYNRFVAGTEAAVVLTFTNGAQILAITMNVIFNGETPSIGGPGIVDQPLPYKAVGATTDAGAITVVFTTSESAP